MTDSFENDATEDQALAEDQEILLGGQDEGQEQVEAATEQDRRDWKAEAIRAQAQLELMQRQQQRQPEPEPPQVVDRVAEIEAEIDRLESELPSQPKDEKEFWRMIETQGKITKLTRQLAVESRRAAEAQVQNLQSASVAERFKAQHAADPVFQQIAPMFDQWVSQLDPSLRSNTGMLEMLRKNLAYDYLQKNGGRVPNQNRRAGAPAPAAPSGAFTPDQQRQVAQQRSAVKFKSEREAQVASFYGMTPEEFYGAKYNEVGPDTDGNGIQIMDLPQGSRRNRRG